MFIEKKKREMTYILSLLDNRITTNKSAGAA